MKRGFMGTCLAVICAVSLAAQAQPPQSEQKKADEAMSKNVTVQGCLQAGEQPNTFVLSNVMKADAAPTGTAATGTAGTTDPDITALKGARVRLIGTPTGTDLKAHVGHTVEVSGALVPQDKSKEPGTSGPPAGTAGAADKNARRLNVKTFKHVSPNCPAR